MKTLIEVHVLQNFAPSNLNRDDTGAPKDAIFGGSRRARISSQCFKRAVRLAFKEGVSNGNLGPQDIATRTKRLSEILVAELVSRGRDEDECKTKVVLALSAIELTIKDDGKTQYLLFLGNRETKELADAIDTHWDALLELPPTEEGKKQVKAKKEAAKKASPEVKKALSRSLDGGKAVDVALFGRMLADMPEKNQYAACQIAHAISTHTVEREFDFYTAVDDMKPEDTAGADMMGTVEFNSACFYRYAVLDCQSLFRNLQGDTELFEKAVPMFLEAFLLSEPTGKQNTFAAHNPPEFVAITIRKNSGPRNLANAFEIPIRNKSTESLTKKSAESLVRKAKLLDQAFGKSAATFVLDLVSESDSEFGIRVDSIAQLIENAFQSARA